MSSLINFDGNEFDDLFFEIDLDNLQNIEKRADENDTGNVLQIYKIKIYTFFFAV